MQQIKNITDVVSVKDQSVKSRYQNGVKIPITTFIEDYMNGRVDLKCSVQEIIQNRTFFFNYKYTQHHLKFLFSKFIPQVTIHSKAQDERVIRDHYDRGNDFFAGFLGDRMVYTSGFFKTGLEDLETAQDQKMNLVCQKLQMKKGERHLDIGCGWGTLVAHSAKYYGTDSTGITIAQKGADYANDQIERWGVKSHARVHRMDYRSIPQDKFDKISCLEMAEHVGVKYFQRFMRQIAGLLKDDGLFYLQIAGLRAGYHQESLVWGGFMGEYIFPGADASCPLSFVVKRLEGAGFEIHSVENVGIHYSLTIQKWYNNWQSHKAEILAKYGEWWFRCWEIFLAWSVDIAKQGNSTCFQIVCNKNLDAYNRARFFGGVNLGERDLISNTKVASGGVLEAA
ncbi:MAG: cyclopropane-fatty-acyl-phospholipid synthase family protein [Bacteroidota bacterium]|nr:cyclopropane-fatty-acyl-phospholipid synthase family protein [Bacteroidota bacterium]MDP4233402.1 cyclopropane-fatty-acyl-phospholipid synthase family protein [Bacteroidota bacterium]MDP4242268.1 cyclopropane-fatty-acyl-phospholipid synthase family protein [Bacteroidota bacterium]MDP4287024.1 cyclopropane-fatty-acyl-phospholipid synthase family protein [Bacteroidota bacterium]